MEKINLKKDGFRIGIQIFDFLLIIVLLVLIVLSIFYSEFFKAVVFSILYDYGFFALFIINFFLEFIPQLITPIGTLVPALAFGLNPHFSILVVILGSFFGSSLGYLVGVNTGFDFLRNIISQKKINKLVYFMNKYGKLAVFIAAISPLPYIPMVIGALNMNKKNFILYGLIPRALGLITFGYGIYFGFIG